MPKVKKTYVKRLDPRAPLVFDTRTLRPGSMRAEDRTVPAPADLGAGMIGIPEGAELRLHVQLEGVSEGTLVTATADAPLAGECARCLEDFTSSIEVRLQELYLYPDAGAEGDDGSDGYQMAGDLLDLEPALRDALVLELPLSPLCSQDCPGLCVECGIRLAEAGQEHSHPAAAAQPGAAANGQAGQERTTTGGSAAPEPRKEP
jgi:uncharacterized protein